MVVVLMMTVAVIWEGGGDGTEEGVDSFLFLSWTGTIKLQTAESPHKRHGYYK